MTYSPIRAQKTRDRVHSGQGLHLGVRRSNNFSWRRPQLHAIIFESGTARPSTPSSNFSSREECGSCMRTGDALWGIQVGRPLDGFRSDWHAAQEDHRRQFCRRLRMQRWEASPLFPPCFSTWPAILRNLPHGAPRSPAGPRNRGSGLPTCTLRIALTKPVSLSLWT